MVLQHDPAPTAPMRSPEEVMRLDRLGASHQTRLSFLRALLRRAAAERWRFTRPRFDIDAKGVGTALYAVDTGARTYTLIAYGHDLAPQKRTDRVIAEEWDATFALFDGTPGEADIERLRANVPRQEAGRYLATELVLARANRSVRLFDAVVGALAAGRQPDAEAMEDVGYLMRTTAVYGNGKFGIADRDRYCARAELAGPFRAEMLAVYLVRAFTADLVEHMARLRAPAEAVPLAPALRRRIGIGNATGLGMAPFLVRHPVLIDRWMTARETALARVRALAAADDRSRFVFCDRLRRSHALVKRWTTDDPVQAPRIPLLAADLERLEAHVAGGAFDGRQPWDRIYRWAERELSAEGLAWTVSLMLEPHGALIDDLADTMAADEEAEHRIDGTEPCGVLRAEIERSYAFALAIDFETRSESGRFWYVSEEKLEPRLGERHREPGAELEQPLAIARDVSRLYKALATWPARQPIAHFLLAEPTHRHIVRRIQISRRHPYGEIRGNLIADTIRPIDILRAKLAFFGVTRFDPKSDKWLRITLYQGAPFPHELADRDWDDWIWGEPGVEAVA